MSGEQPIRVLVTGSDGFVGRWLVRALRARLPRGSQVFGSARVPSPGVDAPAGTVALDLARPGQAAAAVREVSPTCLIHLAAIANVAQARRDARATWAINFGGTMELAEALRAHAPDARFVFVGSSEVYGGTFRTHPSPLSEDAPLDPTNSYAASKAAADLLIGQMAHEGLDAVRFRPFNHTGPGQTEHYVISAFAAQVVRAELGLAPPVLRVGNLDARRDFLDVRDVADAYVAAARAPAGALPPGAVFNVASGNPLRIGDVLQSMLEKAKVRLQVEADPERMRPNDTPIAAGDSSRARAMLNWAPRVSFSETIGAVLDHWRGLLAGPASERSGDRA